MTAATVPALLKLPKRQRLELAERLWLSVADEETLAMPASHKRLLDKRMAAYETGRSVPIPHGELMRRLRKS